MALCGTAIFVLGVLAPAFWLLLTHAFLFGFFSGSSIALIAPIVIQLVRAAPPAAAARCDAAGRCTPRSRARAAGRAAEPPGGVRHRGWLPGAGRALRAAAGRRAARPHRKALACPRGAEARARAPEGVARALAGGMSWTWVSSGALMVVSSALVWRVPAPRLE